MSPALRYRGLIMCFYSDNAHDPDRGDCAVVGLREVDGFMPVMSLELSVPNSSEEAESIRLVA